MYKLQNPYATMTTNTPATWKAWMEEQEDDNMLDMPDLDLTFGNCPWLHDDGGIRQDDPSERGMRTPPAPEGLSRPSTLL